MAKEMEALQYENENLRVKASGSRENEHTKGGEHNTRRTNNDEVNKKRGHNELHNLTDKHEEIAK